MGNDLMRNGFLASVAVLFAASGITLAQTAAPYGWPMGSNGGPAYGSWAQTYRGWQPSYPAWRAAQQGQAWRAAQQGWSQVQPVAYPPRQGYQGYPARLPYQAPASLPLV